MTLPHWTISPTDCDWPAAGGSIATPLTKPRHAGAAPSVISVYSKSMAPDQSQSETTAAGVVGLVRRECWAAVPVGTIESLIAGGRVVDFPSGRTVYSEADAATLAVMIRGLLRVYITPGTAARSPCATFERAAS